MVNAGQKLSHTAGQLGYSQTVLAREIGVSQAAISKIFHGDQVLSFDNAFKLARKLGISLDWLADNEPRCLVGQRLTQPTMFKRRLKCLAIMSPYGDS